MPVVLLVVVKQLISPFSCLLTLLLAVLLVPPLVELVLLVAFVELLVLEPPLLVLVSELPFFFFDVLLPLIAKAGEARVLAVISIIAVTMAIVAKVVVFIYTTDHLELIYIKNCLTMLTEKTAVRQQLTRSLSAVSSHW